MKARIVLTYALAVGLVLGGQASPASAVPVGRLYSSGNLALAIPDGGLLVPLPSISVVDSAKVLDVNVRIRLSHDKIDELEFYVSGPDGTPVTLSINNGGTADDYGSGAANCAGTMTLFDDEAVTPITAGAAPFNGAHKPQGPLSAFDGKSSAGSWRLWMFDDDALQTGTLWCWQIELTLDLCPGFEAVIANHIVGTSADDEIVGTQGVDVVCPGDGNDNVVGLGGDDILDGGAGNDVMVGNKGNDRLIGGPGGDRLQGSNGADVLEGGADNDRLLGGGGMDRLDGGTGTDYCNGQRGKDVRTACEKGPKG